MAADNSHQLYSYASKFKLKTRGSATVEYLDYQIPITQVRVPRLSDTRYLAVPRLSDTRYSDNVPRLSDTRNY